MIDFLLYVLVLALGGLAGSLLLDRDAVGTLQRHFLDHPCAVPTAIGIGFAAGLVWKILS